MYDESKINERTRILKYRQMALAFLKRGKNAGIPEAYLRVTRDKFRDLLDVDYHGEDGIDRIVKLAYDNPNKLATLKYVIIDGGNIVTRNIAGYVILFRIITCDKVGIYKTFSELSNKLQTIMSVDGMNRNDIVDEMKNYDAMFIGEFNKRNVNPHFDTGNVLDELFSYRFDNSKTTIISWSQALDKNRPIAEIYCGEFLQRMSRKEYADPNNTSINPTDKVLRLRVKNSSGVDA